MYVSPFAFGVVVGAAGMAALLIVVSVILSARNKPKT